MPVPPRSTVLPPRNLGVHANPNRGLKLFRGVVYNSRLPGPANNRPPGTRNWLAGISAIGLLAYAARACALMGFALVRSNPLVVRLYLSVVGVSNSYRRPTFTVRLDDTRQSSWRNSA